MGALWINDRYDSVETGTSDARVLGATAGAITNRVYQSVHEDLEAEGSNLRLNHRSGMMVDQIRASSRPCAFAPRGWYQGTPSGYHWGRRRHVFS